MASRPPDDLPTGRMEPTPPTATERNRWVVLNVMRLAGVALVIVGLLLAQGAFSIAGELDRTIGYFFVGMGLLDTFVVPLVLARKWRTPKP